MRLRPFFLSAALLCVVLPQAGFAQAAKEAPSSNAPAVQLSPTAQHAVALLKERKSGDGVLIVEELARGNDFMAEHMRKLLEYGFGHNWDDDDSLSRREKHLIMITAMIATERGHELEEHLKWGLANGVKTEDFGPILSLLTPSLGFNRASNAAGKMYCVPSANRPALCPPVASGEKK